MSLAPILHITRREVRESFTDWRIVLPMVILSLVLPQLLLGAADFAIAFVEDPNLIGSLVPFAMLLVGFIPASFSLIAALETFVGERERNSLEALLAMPVSDTELYLGKLISALVPPLLSSFAAVGFFANTLYFVQPELWAGAMNAERLVQIFVLTFVKATTMVTAAVIISSHTTTIRAANLLASFVLLPMASLIQLEAVLIIGRRWDMLWWVALFLAAVTVALGRTGTAAFNREEILSRENENLNLRAIRRAFGRFYAEYRPAGVAPDDYDQQARFDAGRFYRRELGQLLRDYRWPIGLAVLAAAAGWLTSSLEVANLSFGQVYNRLGLGGQAVLSGGRPEPNLLFAVATWVGNTGRVFLAGMLAMLCFGVLSFLIPFFAFGGIGHVAGDLAERGGNWFALGVDSPLQFLLAYVLPHGIIELPAATLAAAMGLRIGVSLLSPPPGFTVGDNMLWSLAQFFKVLVYVVAPLLLVAALIEWMVVPLIIQALY